jgi:hypothetical protein
MRSKLGALALGLLAITVIAIGAIGPATSAAADPETEAEIEAAIASGDHTRLPTWLRHSIIVCAAETIGVHPATVKAGLLEGHSLKEIAARYGVRAGELERGILACEADFLQRQVENGTLTRWQAYRIFEFIEDHIHRIINYHYSPNDPVLSDAATDVAVTDEPVPDAVMD